MLNQKNSYSHVYLYAKGWYKKSSSPINDLKKILGQRSGMESQYITCDIIINTLSKLCYEVIAKSNNPNLFIEFVNDISFQDNWWKFGAIGCRDKQPSSNTHEVIALKCLSVLANVPVYDIENGLYQPDYTILPCPKR